MFPASPWSAPGMSLGYPQIPFGPLPEGPHASIMLVFGQVVLREGGHRLLESGLFENGAMFLVVQMMSQLLCHRMLGTEKTEFSFSR